MSKLTENLTDIYEIKLQIKEALGTDSDDLSQYPSYISALGPAVSGYSYITTNGDHNVASYEMVNVNVPNVIPSGYVYVNGTYNISENGTFDISTYENAYVNVQTGGGDEYAWIDAASYTMVIGEKYAFNGKLGDNPQTQITSQFVEMYPALAPYLNWYVYGIGGENNRSNWSKTAIIETPGDLPGHGVIAKGTWTEPVTGNPMFIVDELYAAKYAGGNGGLTIQNNGTQDVTRYSYVNVNVSGGSGTSYEFIYLNNSDNNLWESSWSNLEVGSSYEFICRLNSSGYSDGTGDIPLGYYAYGMYKGGGDGRERPVCISGASSSLYSYELNNMVVRGDFVGKARLVDDTQTGIFTLGEMHYANMGGIGQKYIYEDGTHDVSEYDEVYVEGLPQYTIYDELSGKNPAPNGWYLTISDSTNSVTVYWLIILENDQSNVDVCFEFDITKVLAHVDIDTSNLNVHLTNWNGSNTVNFYTNATDMSDNLNPSFVTPWPLDQNDDQEIPLNSSNICCIGFNENASNGHNYFWYAHPSTAESI